MPMSPQQTAPVMPARSRYLRHPHRPRRLHRLRPLR